jgi:hypothetical protein
LSPCRARPLGLAALACVATSAAACKKELPGHVQIFAGPAASDHVEFKPRAAFAEFFELPGYRSELRLTLASYPGWCDDFVPPKAGETSASVTVSWPDGVAPGPGSYAWLGASAHGDRARPDRAYALPTARLGRRALLLPPGGSIEIESLELKENGHVTGLLGFEFPGDAERVATSLRGSFTARICRVSRAGG